MKAVKTIVLFTTACLLLSNTQAQIKNSIASERAILFADSLLQSFHHHNFDQYTNLSYPGVISYYGGNKNFREYIQRTRALTNDGISENLQLTQIVNQRSEWQCVIQRIQQTLIDGKKARIITYMVGQSKDKGQNWKFFDVAFNSINNLVYIMPDIFETLTIPQRQVVFEKGTDTANM